MNLRLTLITQIFVGILSLGFLSLQAQTDGDFRSTSSGNWSNTSNASIWEQYHSSASTVWKVKAQDAVTETGAQISAPTYTSANWVNGVVPGTVFSSYVLAGLEADPNFADNVWNVDKSKYDKNFWYRTEFNVPADYVGKKIWLNFDGINKWADIYVNGIKLLANSTDQKSLKGFMQRGKFDITSLVNNTGKNAIAILVYLPERPIHNWATPTYISADGWDWMPQVPGLEIGLTDDVFLSASGNVSIVDPWVRTKEVSSATSAKLSIASDLKNNSNATINGVLKGTIMPGNIVFTENVNLNAGETKNITAFTDSTFNNIKLWWPNGYGDPNLYTCKFEFLINNVVSDSLSKTFGIRKYSYDLNNNVFHLLVNGTKIYIKGGNWGMSEYLLRCRGEDYFTRVRFHKEMNFNMIRNWLGSTTDEEFYDACDKYGIMVWDDFWFNNIYTVARDLPEYKANVDEKVKKLRNHPSVAVWCGANEGEVGPPAEMNNYNIQSIALYDGNDRLYRKSSTGQGTSNSGPWNNMNPKAYFTDPGSTHDWSFRSEIGTATFPNVESFKKFMPANKLWPRNDMWNKHFFSDDWATGGGSLPSGYMSTITKNYGVSNGIDDFCKKAQFLNLQTMKSIFEGWQDRLFNNASGVLIWMSQSAYPSMIWQTYDYYYDLTGSYFGAKSACEPVHIQWNPATNSVKIINTTTQSLNQAKAEAHIYNSDGTEVTELAKAAVKNVASNTAVEGFVLQFDTNDLALNKTAIASSKSNDAGNAGAVTDGNSTSRWSSNYSNNEWIYIDLGSQQTFGSVKILWESAYAKEYKIQVSTDATTWTDVYYTNNGSTGLANISFQLVSARYVKMLGITRGTNYGYSIYDFNVQTTSNVPALSDLHFIKLKLSDASNKILSENFYWRGTTDGVYTGVNNLPAVTLNITNSEASGIDGKKIISCNVSNPANSAGVAFGIRVKFMNSSTGEIILPAIIDDNYFSLLKGEAKMVHIEYNPKLLNGGNYSITATAFNN